MDVAAEVVIRRRNRIERSGVGRKVMGLFGVGIILGFLAICQSASRGLPGLAALRWWSLTGVLFDITIWRDGSGIVFENSLIW